MMANVSSVPAEAGAFLAFVGICMAFLVVLYLYLTKRFCFTATGNFPCCDQPLRLDKAGHVHDELGQSFAFAEEAESTSDSEDEMLQRLQRSASSHYNLQRQASVDMEGGPRGPLSLLSASQHHAQSTRSSKRVQRHESLETDLLLHGSQSSERLLNRSRSPQSVSMALGSDRDTPCSSTGIYDIDERSPSTSTVTTVIGTDARPLGEVVRHRVSRSSLNRGASSSGAAGRGQGNTSDLISLAEKGRIGKGSSGSSESGSADTEEEAHVPFLSRSADGKTISQRTKPHGSGGSTTSEPTKTMGRQQTGPPVVRRSDSSRVSLKQTTYENSGFQRSQDSEDSTASGMVASSSSADPRGPPRTISRQTTISSQRGADSSLTEPVKIKVGTLEIAHTYDAPTKKLQITVIGAADMPSKDRGGATAVCVRLVLLPFKRQKAKTKTRPCVSGNPVFEETFAFTRVAPEDVLGMGCRFRVYSSERMRREQLVGEGVVAFSCSKPLQTMTKLRLTLEPRSNLSSMQAAAASPELLLGLAYNGTTGRLQVGVIKGSQFRNPLMSRAPDTFVKLTLVSSSGAEIARSKSSIRRGQPNPLFKETFVFQVALFQLPDVSLMAAVYNKKSLKRKKEMIGWFSLGHNSSGEEEMTHWNEMRDSKGEQICRWHVLLES